MEERNVAASDDLRYIREVLARTRGRIDPHAFHFVIWGTLVLVVYPLLNALELAGHLQAMLWVGIGALVLGSTLGCLFEIRLARRPRLEGENTFVSRQIVRIVALDVGLASFLSVAGPATGIVDPNAVSIVWGFAYANMAFMIGVVYARESMVAGIVIAAATLAAWWCEPYRGFILGPAMGLGMIVPGILAERRVARLREAR